MPTYGASAIRAFAHGVSALTGNDVAVEVRGRGAFTDGKRVVLPAEGVWAEGDFLALCGVACHEVAHVWFGSTDLLARLYALFPKVAPSRVQKAFNVVVDVADEARFERAMPRAEALFGASRELALSSGAYPAAPPPSVAEDQLLCAGILWSRSGANSAVRKALRVWPSRAGGFRQVASILDKAREARGRSGAPFRPARTGRQSQKLVGLTRQLIDLLDRLYPQRLGQGAGDQGTQGQGGHGDRGTSNGPADAPGGDGRAPQTRPTPPPTGPGQARSATADPMAQRRRDAVVEATKRALAAEGGGARADSSDWQAAADARGGGGLLGVGAAGGVGFRQDCYDRVWPSFKRVAQGLATGPTIVREEGFTSGGRLSRPHRAAVDGRCFLRASWDDGQDAAVAVVFDQSASMASRLDVFLPVGAALVDALGAAPNVEVAVWRYGSRVERVGRTADLRQGKTMGGTATHLAVLEASAWLQGKSARRRALILFTDGQPDDAAATSEAVARLRQAGAVLLVGAIGLGELDCARSMPGGIVFSVDPDDAGSSLHAAANRLRRAR